MSLRRELEAWVPDWWRGQGGGAGRMLDVALWPAERLFRGLVAVRNRMYDVGLLPVRGVEIPVVSVGNLAIGGAGKTPVSAWLVHRLQAWGRRPAIVLRGYGRDEMLVHQELNPQVPLFPAPRRVDAAAAAAARGCDVAVVDDGFQHRALRRDLDVVLVAAEDWTAVPRLLPRGPWREGPAALRRAHVAMVTRKTASRARAEDVRRELGRLAPWCTHCMCYLAPGRLAPLNAAGGAPLHVEALQGLHVLAVATLARPAAFAAQLRAAGAAVELLSFPDHHEFSDGEVAEIGRRAAGRPVVVTRKEAVKLRGRMPAGSGLVLEQEVRMEAGERELDAVLRSVLGSTKA